MVDKLLLTVTEAAERLGIGRSHVYIFVMRGELPSVKLGRSRRVPVDALADFVEKLRVEHGNYE
jgi:excisionase family DNA binding protein